MPIGKKKIKEIQNISFAYKIIQSLEKNKFKSHLIGGTPWYDCPPEMWIPEEQELWDILFNTEEEVKSEILNILK